MCGICGVLSFEARGLEDLPREEIRLMKNSLRHRGPDDEGEYFDRHIALGFRRLSIIDIHGGNQPLFNENKKLVLVVNGEIYNYIELSEGLKARGHIFSTKSDCETILHLYEERGIDCLFVLRGMFSFALWDVESGKLFLARDRMGEKPFYFYSDNKKLFFASELKSLIKTFSKKPSLNHQAIDLFLCHQYVPEPLTLIEGVHKLPAAHYLNIDLAKPEIKPKRYWDPSDADAISGNPVECIRKELDDFIPLVLRSDVPIGIALSGGIDSGIIATLASSKHKERLSAFTVGYSGRPVFDERIEAGKLAEYLKIPLYETELSAGDFLNDFLNMIEAADDPVADLAAYGYYRVMRLAHEHDMKVMLSGFGGDELFWGYDWVLKSLQRKNSQPLIFYDLEPGFRESYELLSVLYKRDFSDTLFSRESYTQFEFNPSIDKADSKICKLICDVWLISNCVVLGDRLSMANSVELRLPLLDHKFIETVYGLRKKYEDYKLLPKAWFKEAFSDLFPQEAANRSKRGFTVPGKIWRKIILDKYSKLLTDGFLVENGIFENKSLQSLIKKARSESVCQVLGYRIAYLELWCRLILANGV